MPLTLARGETVLFPMPYVEAERPPYVVTTQRLIESNEFGERTLVVRQIVMAQRAKTRPYAALGTLLLCLGLISAAAGAYFVYSVFGMEAASVRSLLPAKEPTDDAPTPDPSADPTDPHKPGLFGGLLPDDPSGEPGEHPEDDAWRQNVLKTRATGYGLLALGAIFALLGLRAFKKLRFFVVCRTQDTFMRVRVNDKVQQDIILATLQAVK